MSEEKKLDKDINVRSKDDTGIDAGMIENILEQCFIKDEGGCIGCKFYTGNGFEECVKNVGIKILDLIHRLQADKNDMHKDLIQAEKYAETLSIENAEQKAEIERLNKFVMSEEQVRKCCADIIQETIVQVTKDTAKAFWFMAVTKILDELNPGPKEKDTSFANGVIGARYRTLRIINTICKEQFGVEVE